ncbi:hypothetical protein COCNU_10G009100 [Cocos nucifera]|uniref:Transposase (putative) gypsy type domain-containing protein n=1 Tax=Cocos nucifera TaxID=13894 RepID=A0A8K0IM54_COCNU|nr:hypothetical protein COCNU_10G009090 [Cocos nucifera]KAG1362691.1 hypothetical protein COCNU_10G009100 [Cocos nucifera]
MEASTSSHDDSESLVRRFLDYFGLDTELSILVDAKLERLRKKYFMPENFQLIAPNSSDRVTQPPMGCVAFYDESFRFGLHFSLHPFIYNILDYYGLQPIQVTPNAIRIILVFIIRYSFTAIDLRTSLFRALFALKKHPTENGWWYFPSRPNYKFGHSFPSSIHD